MINWNVRNEKSTTLLFSRFLSHSARHQRSAEHILGNAGSTRFCESLQHKTKCDQWEQSCFVAVGRTDRQDKANGIFLRLFCKTHVKTVTSICNYIWHPPPLPQCLSHHRKCVSVRSRVTRTVQAERSDVTSAYLSFLSVITALRGFLFFIAPRKTKLRGLSPRANYTDRAAAAGRRS